MWPDETFESLGAATPIKVGIPDHNREALEAEHGAENVRNAYQLWSMLLQKIPYAPIAHAILAAGSPQVGWKKSCEYYSVHSDKEKQRITRDWYNLS